MPSTRSRWYAHGAAGASAAAIGALNGEAAASGEPVNRWRLAAGSAGSAALPGRADAAAKAAAEVLAGSVAASRTTKSVASLLQRELCTGQNPSNQNTSPVS